MGLDGIYEYPQGMRWTYQVKDQGKVKQELNFFDGCRGAKDGKFDDNELFSIRNINGDKAKEFFDTDGDGMVDYVQYYEKKGDKFVETYRMDSEDEDFELKEKEMAKIAQGGIPENRPVIFDEKERAYDVLVNEGRVARYLDENGNGILEDGTEGSKNELHVVMELSELDGKQLLTKNIDSRPMDGKADTQTHEILLQDIWHKLYEPVNINVPMTELRDQK